MYSALAKVIDLSHKLVPTYIRFEVTVTVGKVFVQQLHEISHIVLEKFWQILTVQVVKDLDKQQ